MTVFTRLTPEELYICEESIYELVNDNEAGTTRLDNGSLHLKESLASLEKFAEMLVRRDEFDIIPPPTVSKRNNVIYTDQSWRRSWLNCLPHYFAFYEEIPRECRYSVQVETFFACCADYTGRLSFQHLQDFCKDPSRYYHAPNYTELKDLTNEFVKDYRKRLRDPKVRKAIREERKAVRERYKEFSSYVLKLFAIWSRLIVIRIDLGYVKDTNATIEDLDKDIKHLFKNERHNKRLFGYLKGYIIKFEYGMAKGNHAHLILFYDGSKRNNASDSYIAKEIGEYWKDEIAEGRGGYWNCNADKIQYAKIGRLGIGVVHADDQQKINNLLFIVKYLCKKEQFIKPIARPRMKLIRKKHLPRRKGKKRGAPRASERTAKAPRVTKIVSKRYKRGALVDNLKSTVALR